MEPIDPAPLERRHDDLIGVGNAKFYLFSALGLTVLMVFALLAIVLIDPAVLDLSQVRYMSYFLAAIIVALFAGAGINVVNVLNGHSAAMIRLVGEKERAKGVIQGLQENPNTNVE
jgi:hypothetical protein